MENVKEYTTREKKEAGKQLKDLRDNVLKIGRKKLSNLSKENYEKGYRLEEHQIEAIENGKGYHINSIWVLTHLINSELLKLKIK
jgi:hypothetical protein